MALVDNMFCPYHREGIIFMWYALLKNGECIYEYDDRREQTKLEKFRQSYLEGLEEATQKYYRRNITPWENIKRIGLLVFDNVLCSVKPELIDTVKENSFYDVDTKSISQLGIMGNGGKIYFNTKNGIFHLDGNRNLNVFFMLDCTRVDVTNNSAIDYNKDLIERHYASYEFDMSGNAREVTSDGKMNAIGIGYHVNLEAPHRKEDGSTEKIKFDCELIYVLPLRSPNYISFSITSPIETDIELHLTFLANDDNNVIHLEKDKKQTFRIGF